MSNQLQKTAIAAVLIAGVAVLSLSSMAEAKRRCPRGYEDVNDVCVKTSGHS